jgi:CheY-like chemotaxis protein
MQMPQMNGLEVLERVRADPSTAALPVLMLSANVADVRQLASVQPNGYLEKPFQMQELLAAVETFKLGSSTK